MINEYIENLAERAKVIAKEGDYIKDGLLHCGVCHEIRQQVFNFNGRLIMPEVLCRCEREKREQEEKKLAEIDKQMQKKQLMKGIIEAERFTECIFENDDGRQPEIATVCQRYIETFPEMKKRGFGLMLYGERGKGKTFYAACIANALMDKGRPVLFGTLANLVMRYIDAMHNKAEPLNVKDYDLIIIDDLGIENATQTAFTIVDSAYSNKIPMIITTNLLPSDLKDTGDISKGRIYDRLLEACPYRLLVKNSGSRAKQGRDNLKEMMEIMKKAGGKEKNEQLDKMQ